MCRHIEQSIHPLVICFSNIEFAIDVNGPVLVLKLEAATFSFLSKGSLVVSLGNVFSLEDVYAYMLVICMDQ